METVTADAPASAFFIVVVVGPASPPFFLLHTVRCSRHQKHKLGKHSWSRWRQDGRDDSVTVSTGVRLVLARSEERRLNRGGINMSCCCDGSMFFLSPPGNVPILINPPAESGTHELARQSETDGASFRVCVDVFAVEGFFPPRCLEHV